MKRILLKSVLFILPSLFLISCNDDNSELMKEKEMRLLSQYLDMHNIQTTPKSSGLYYLPGQEGTGTTPGTSDWVIMRYTARMINDRIFDTSDEALAINNNVHMSTRIYGEQRVQMSTLILTGVMEGLQLMREGGTARLIMPSHLAFGSIGSGIVPPFTSVIYDIDLVKVIRDPVAYEQQLIDDYMALYNHADSSHLVVRKESSGTWFIEIEPGTGENHPSGSDRVSLYYRGSLTDGRVFDSNMGGSLFQFSIGAGSTIAGFEEGVKLMKKGGKARIVLPSSRAYGPEGSGKIIGYTPLVFDLVLVDIQAE
jgi:FKBP-type peptidyl-prolyl cis-trans isomerase